MNSVAQCPCQGDFGEESVPDALEEHPMKVFQAVPLVAQLSIARFGCVVNSCSLDASFDDCQRVKIQCTPDFKTEGLVVLFNLPEILHS